MTCSSSTTSTPRRIAALVALAVAAAAPAGADAGSAARLVAAAQHALSRGDGIAAEARLRQARAAGASEDAVRAAMGEALLAQGDLAAARRWLAPERFAAGTAAQGFWTLGRLELSEGRLPEAGRALDRALALAPRDPRMWTDIARLRLAGGERAGAIEAAEHALELDPRSAEALAFRGVLVRDQYGPAAALPWFDAALKSAPGTPAFLADRAATLGDLGHAAAALGDARALPGGDKRALWIEAVIAARAGQGALARKLLERAGPAVRERPGGLLLGGALALEAGDLEQAISQLERLVRLQPDNPAAQLLLARALSRSGDAASVVDRFAGLAERGDAPPYLQVLVARAFRKLGRRGEGEALLARARAPRPPLAAILPAATIRPDTGTVETAVARVRTLLGQGRSGEAASAAARLVAASPGSPDARLLAGDVELARGRPDMAIGFYRAAAATRFGERELLRLDRVSRLTGRAGEADRAVYLYAAQNPRSLTGARLLADAYARAGRWADSARLLEWIAARRGRADPRLLADLALARKRLTAN